MTNSQAGGFLRGTLRKDKLVKGFTSGVTPNHGTLVKVRGGREIIYLFKGVAVSSTTFDCREVCVGPNHLVTTVGNVWSRNMYEFGPYLGPAEIRCPDCRDFFRLNLDREVDNLLSAGLVRQTVCMVAKSGESWWLVKQNRRGE